MNKAEIIKIIKSNIVYYYTVALIFILLTIYGMHFGEKDILLIFILPVITVLLGFFVGNAGSYAKWGFPVYIILLNFCLSVFVFYTIVWSLVIVGFFASLAGVILRHLLIIRGRKKP